MRTEDMIDALVADVRPVRPLPPPTRRLSWWLAGSLAFCALVVVLAGPRPDLGSRIAEPRFAIEVAAALATGALAALGAFSSVVPGRAGLERLAFVPPLALWLGSLGEGCWRTLLRLGPGGVGFAPDLVCFPAIVVTGSVPALLLFAMLRRGAPVTPATTAGLAALAAAAMGAAALRLFHPQDASIMVLVWQCGTVAVLTAIGAATGRGLLGWPLAATLPRA